MKSFVPAPRYSLILVCFRPADLAPSVAFCNATFSSSWVKRRVLLLNNPDLMGAARACAGPSWEIVIGSNSMGEFSGWQEGLQYLNERGSHTIFVNDTVVSHRVFTLSRRFALIRAIRGASDESIVGFVDSTHGSLSVDGLALSGWVSTYCFAIGAAALRKLGYRIQAPEVAVRCIKGGLDEGAFFSHLSTDLAEHLRRLLFHGGWYASEALTLKNSARLTFKARCVVLEKYLSARCESLSISRVDPFDRLPVTRWLDRLQTSLRRRLFVGYQAVRARL